MTDQHPPITHLSVMRTIVAKGGGAWPPPSPYVWTASWWDTAGNPFQIVLTIRFNSSFSGGDNALLGVDYDLDPKCPWEYLIVVRATDNAKLVRQIPRSSRTGTLSPTQLHNFGLDLFTDIGSITVGVSPG